jgi:hypothetical protein
MKSPNLIAIVLVLLFAVNPAVNAISSAAERARFAKKLPHQNINFPLREGGGEGQKRKGGAVGTKKRSIFGLPVLIGPTLYGHLDFISFVLYFGYYANVFEGMASKVFSAVGIFHSLHGLATNYEGKGSWLQRLLGINISVPKWTMYWFDIIASATLAVLPSFIDGYTDETATMMTRVGGLSGCLLLSLCE